MQEQKPRLAALWMLGSVVSFSAMAVAGRALAGQHDTFEIMLWRSVIGFLLVVGIAGSMGRLREVQSHHLGQHVLRNILHFSGQNLWFWALTAIPLAQVFALEFTSPVWVILLSPLLLGERLTRPRLIAAGLGFTGAMIVARPDLTQVEPGVLAAAASAICFALTIIMTRQLARIEGLVSILFWLTLIQGILGLIAAGADGAIRLPDATTLPWLLVVGVTGVGAHFCLTRALSLAPAAQVVPVDFLRLPLIALIGMMFYNEGLDTAVFIGGAVIFLGNWINLRPAPAPAPQVTKR